MKLFKVYYSRGVYHSTVYVLAKNIKDVPGIIISSPNCNDCEEIIDIERVSTRILHHPGKKFKVDRKGLLTLTK